MSTLMLAVVVVSISIIAYFLGKRILKPQFFRAASLILLVLYLAGYLYVMVFSRTSLVAPRWNGIPFRLYAFANVFFKEFAFNILIFIPIGLLLRGVFPDRKALHILLFGTIISVCIEIIQLIIHIGVCDINDLMANVVGCTIAILIAQLSSWILGRVNASNKKNELVKMDN